MQKQKIYSEYVSIHNPYMTQHALVMGYFSTYAYPSLKSVDNNEMFFTQL